MGGLSEKRDGVTVPAIDSRQRDGRRKMKRFVTALMVLLGTQTAFAQRQAPQKHDGYWWVSLNSEDKLYFVDGYTAGLGFASDQMTLKCLSVEPAHDKEALHRCAADPWMVPFDFGKSTMGQVSDGVDDFYKDFRNKLIDVRVAIRYVRDELAGVPPDSLAQELNDWRGLPQ
jgi:hypothetical protein